ncbi:uncharacterized protein LOC134838108 [Culicoides brevitarsis]|uniref:uncharacterized protein LOC134838108 n=1 Tax=Culicoides brevitarsis TaxID=469753 RepID=UPI00307BC57C
MSRPANLPYPSIWSRFEANSCSFRIQDLTEEHYQAAINLFLSDFVPDEPVAKSMEIASDPASLEEMCSLWLEVFRYRVSLACFNEKTEELVGVNAVFIETGGEEFKATAAPWKKVFDANNLVAERVNIKEKFKVDRFLGAFGLVVSRKYRGFGIGTEILRARIPLCKALGLKVTSNNFSGEKSQRIAEKAGFKVDVSVTFDELANAGYKFPNITEACIKVMSLEIN